MCSVQLMRLRRPAGLTCVRLSMTPFRRLRMDKTPAMDPIWCSLYSRRCHVEFSEKGSRSKNSQRPRISTNQQGGAQRTLAVQSGNGQ